MNLVSESLCHGATSFWVKTRRQLGDVVHAFRSETLSSKSEDDLGTFRT